MCSPPQQRTRPRLSPSCCCRCCCLVGRIQSRKSSSLRAAPPALQTHSIRAETKELGHDVVALALSRKRGRRLPCWESSNLQLGSDASKCDVGGKINARAKHALIFHGNPETRPHCSSQHRSSVTSWRCIRHIALFGVQDEGRSCWVGV